MRRVGPYVLRQLIGRSSLTMAWLALDTRRQDEALVMLPRTALPTEAAKDQWMARVGQAARIDHPRLLRSAEQGVHEHWPWLAAALPPGAQPLALWSDGRDWPAPVDTARWCADILEGLGYLHDAGCAHGDLGVHALVVDRAGHLLLWGMGAAHAGLEEEAGEGEDLRLSRAPQRQAAARDLLALALQWHHWLARRPAFDEADLPRALGRLAREMVRLPWDLPAPIPDALRAMVNRATDQHPARRYLSARSLLAAIERWCTVDADEHAGALSLLADRLQTAGHLPARPGLAHRVVQIGRMEHQRIDALTDVILEDPALSFELLRVVNAAGFGSRRLEGVATVRRAVELMGTTGVRRAASGLRPWPGPLAAEHARALERALRRACVAGHLAALLTPAGLDPEASFMAAMLQRLGQMLLLYHFPDEAVQIERLVAGGGSSAAKDRRGAPGMALDTATLAVLGVRQDELAVAVARHWGLDEEVQQLLLPLSLQGPVLTPSSTEGWLRLIASCASEAVDATGRTQVAAALQLVVTRYAKVLGLAFDELVTAIQTARRRAAGTAQAHSVVSMEAPS